MGHEDITPLDFDEAIEVLQHGGGVRDETILKTVYQMRVMYDAYSLCLLRDGGWIPFCSLRKGNGPFYEVDMSKHE